MTGEQRLLQMASFALAIAIILFGDRLFGLALLAILVLPQVIGSLIRKNPSGHVFGLHPQLFGGVIFLVIGVMLVFATLQTYVRDEDLPASLFWPVFYGLGAVLCLTVATASFRYWRTRR